MCAKYLIAKAAKIYFKSMKQTIFKDGNPTSKIVTFCKNFVSFGNFLKKKWTEKILNLAILC